MATRSQLRTWLRRRLQEPDAAQWTDASLNDYINSGYQFIQEEIEVIDPEAFLYIDTTDTVKDQALYAVPVNLKAPRRFQIKMKAADDFKDVTEKPLDESFPVDQQTDSNRSSQTPMWSLQGRYLRVDPAPGAAVTAGIRLTYVPVLTLGSDDDVPEIPVNLHYSIVVAAQYIALADTANVTDREATQKELSFHIARLPRHYVKTLAKPGGEGFRPAERLKFGENPNAGRFADFEVNDT